MMRGLQAMKSRNRRKGSREKGLSFCFAKKQLGKQNLERRFLPKITNAKKMTGAEKNRWKKQVIEAPAEK